VDIQEKTEKEKELEHQYHRNIVIVKKGTTSSLFLWVRQTRERRWKKIWILPR
jgi:hypothetical protein